MVSRSGFSIRRLISTRRPRSNSEGAGRDRGEANTLTLADLDFHDDLRRSSRDSETTARSRGGPKSPRSPRSPRSIGGGKGSSVRHGHGSMTKKAPQPIVVMGRSGSVHRISGPLPPLPDTPHSSTSSLCSCDCRASPDLSGSGSGSGSGTRSPGLCSTRSKTPDTDGPRVAPPPPLSPPYPSSNAHHQSHDSKSSNFSDTSFLHDCSPDAATDSNMNLLQALSYQQPTTDSQQQHQQQHKHQHQQRDGQNPPTPALASEGISENVRQLILETDEAFKAVGTEISEARMASESFSSSFSSTSSAFSQPPSTTQSSPRSSDPGAGFRKDLKSVSPWNSPVRKASVTKAKRRKSTKKGRRQLQQQQQQQQKQQRKAMSSSSRGGARWTLPENVTGLLNGRLFHRIEADEMLTPSQLEEWKANRLSRMQANRSTDTLRTTETDGSETPVEPFHLEDLPTRIGAAGVRLSIPSPIAEVPTPRSFDFDFGPAETATDEGTSNSDSQGESAAVEQEKAMKRDSKDSMSSVASTPAHAVGQEDGDDMTFQNLAFPAPPQKSPLRLQVQQPRRQLPPLPTIPEVMVTSPDGAQAKADDGLGEPIQEAKDTKPRQPPQEMLERGHSDDYVFFNSNPYTMTMPTFRHGPIRFSKADVLLDSAQMVPDETLDWTAFQMAILGGAGDFFSDSVDFTRLADADEVDELAVWFEGFGFSHAGRLVGPEEQRQDDAATRARMGTKAVRGSQSRSRPRTTSTSSSTAETSRRRPVLDTAGAAAGSPPTADSPPSPAAAGDYSPVSSSGNSTPTATPRQQQGPLQEAQDPQRRRMEMVQIQSLPIPVAIEYPNAGAGFWQIGQQATGGLTGGLGIRRWTAAEGHPRKYLGTEAAASTGPDGGRKPSVDSLPTSPMLELVVNRGVDGDEYLVPMGYNLGHDLGDFLKWESQNVYAAGFFGSD